MPNEPQWGTVTIEVPDFLKDTRNAINSVAEFLVTMLDIVLASLQLVKAFLTAYIDPIMSLLQKIIDEINGLIHDIRQMGIYITGDWKLMEYPFDDIRGGYDAFERRMVAKLTDRTDPTRPDISGRTQVFGLFFYLSVDISDIQRLIAFIMRLVGFFKQEWTGNTLPSVIINEIRYGSDATDALLHPVSMGEAFKQLAGSGDVPQVAQVRFKTYTPNKNTPFSPFPSNALGPDGFAITVSTFPDGIKVQYDKPRSNTTTDDEGKQPRDYGVVRGTDGKPVVLYGGTGLDKTGMLELPTDLGYNHGTQNGGPVAGSTRIYGYTTPAANAPIPLDIMDGYFQKTFWLDKTEVAFQSFTEEYSFNMSFDDMPYEGDIVVNEDGTVEIKPVLLPGSEGAKQASTVYVRVAACNENALEKFKYDFANTQVTKMAAAPGYIVVPPKTGCGDVTDIGAWSQPQRITFPTADTAMYLESVKSALVVLFLCRPDLVTMEELKLVLTPEQIKKIENDQLIVEGTANKACGLEGLKQLLQVLYDGVHGPSYQWKRSGEEPLDFRFSLDRRVRKFVQDMYAKTGPQPDVESFIVENTTNLRTVQWKNILEDAEIDTTNVTEAFEKATLLESINKDTDAGKDLTSGLAINPWCMGVNGDMALQRNGLITGRTPQMFEAFTGDSIVLRDSVPKAEIDEYLATLPVNIASMYRASFVNEDGDIEINWLNKKAMELMLRGLVEGSADRSPVVFSNQNEINKIIDQIDTIHSNPNRIVFARTLLTNYNDGILIEEAKIALSMAGNLWKRGDDGAWIAIRFLDVMPGIDDFLETIRNWIESIKNAIGSIVDTIIKYIEWLEARVIETQQLIRRINALIQSLLGNLFQVPACSALMCVSNGTDGLLADYMNSKYKPSDGPLAYGAGLALVVPLMPSFVYDLLLLFFKPKDGLAGAAPSDGIPLEGLPGPPGETEEDPPDVL